MAIRLSEVFVEIGAKTAKFNSAIGKADSRLAKFGGRLKGFAKENQFALAAVGVAGVLAFKSIVTAAGDFDASMRRVAAVSGATGEEFKKLTETAKELGATTQFSASQAAAGMEFLAKAGFDTNKVLAAIPATLQLAAAASLDLGSAADIVTNIMSGFRLETSQLGRANDVLVKAFTSSNTNLVELGESMKLAGPVAVTFGQSLEDTVAVLGSLADAGFKASLGGTALRGALIRLSAPSKENEKLLKKAGIAVFDTTGKMRNFIDILDDIGKSTLTPTERIKIFGIRAGPAMESLLGKGIDSIREFSNTLEKSVGTTARIAAVQMEGFNGAIKRLISVFEGLQIAIADSGLLEFAKKLVEGLTGLLKIIASLPSEVLALGAVLAGTVTIAAGLSAVLVTLGGFLAAIKIAFLGQAAAATVASTALVGTSSAFSFATASAGGFAASLSALAAPLTIIALAIAGLTIGFLKWKAAIEEADSAAVRFADSQKTIAQRMKEGFAIASEFEGVTLKQARAFKNGAVEAAKLSRAIRGLAIAQSQAGDVAAKESIGKQIENLKLLRDAAMSSAEEQKLIAQDKTAVEIGLAEFSLERLSEMEEEKTNKLIEQELIRLVNTAETDAQKMVAEANLAEFRKQKSLEVFSFQKSLTLQLGALLKSSFGRTIVDLTKGTKTFAEATKGLLRSTTDFALQSLASQVAASAAATLKQIVQAKSLASVRAIAAEAGKGLLGIATATIAVAAFSALISRFANFQQGGEVTGRGGIDSVPALLTPGERVLTPAQNRNFKGGGATSIVVNIFDPVVDSDDRLSELADRVGSAFMDKLLLEGRLAT